MRDRIILDTKKVMIRQVKYAILLGCLVIHSSCNHLAVGLGGTGCGTVVASRYACEGGSLILQDQTACIDNRMKKTDIIQFHTDQTLDPDDPHSPTFSSSDYYYYQDYISGNVFNKVDPNTVCLSSESTVASDPNALIRDPNVDCPSQFDFRLQEGSCTLVPGGDETQWAAGNGCGTYYYDTYGPNSQESSRSIHISFQIKDITKGFDNGYAIGIFSDYENATSSIDYKAYINSNFTIPSNLLSVKLITGPSDALVWQNNSDGSVKGIVDVSVPFSTVAGSSLPANDVQSIDLDVVLMRMSVSGGNEYLIPEGTHCTITCSNSYSNNDDDYQMRDLNVICFKNAGEEGGIQTTPFSSDIRTYQYKNKAFQKYVETSFGDQVHCRTENSLTTAFTLPENVVDADGDAVLLFNDFEKTGNIIEFSTYTSQAFIDGPLNSWYVRLLNAVRIGLDEEEWDPELEDLKKDEEGNEGVGVSAEYDNRIATLVVKGFKIYDDNLTLNSNNSHFQDFLIGKDPGATTEISVYDNLQISHTAISITTPNVSITDEEIAENYTPVCVAFSGKMLDLYTGYYPNKAADYVNGDVIASMLHEMGIGWYAYGSCDYADLSINYLAAINAYVYDQSATMAGTCLMRDWATTNPEVYAGNRKGRLDYGNGDFRFSSGVTQRLLNVLSATYKK